MKFIAVFFLLLVGSLGQNLNAQTDKRVQNTNLTNGVAIDGYDPVAYFTQGKAVKGNKQFVVYANGVTYYCSSSQNKALFEKDFSKWLNDHINELPVPKEQVQEYLKERTW